MLLLDNGEMVMDDEEGYEGMPPLKEKETDSSEEFPTNEQLGLVVQRVLATQIKEDDGQQRENIFYTHCHIKDKVCSLIINPGSCTKIGRAHV